MFSTFHTKLDLSAYNDPLLDHEYGESDAIIIYSFKINFGVLHTDKKSRKGRRVMLNYNVIEMF
jgi:hypothetical protein